MTNVILLYDTDYGINSINLGYLYRLKPFKFIKWIQQKLKRQGKES